MTSDQPNPNWCFGQGRRKSDVLTELGLTAPHNVHRVDEAYHGCSVLFATSRFEIPPCVPNFMSAMVAIKSGESVEGSVVTRARSFFVQRMKGLSRVALAVTLCTAIGGCGEDAPSSAGRGPINVVLITPKSATIAEQSTVKLQVNVQINNQPAPNEKVSWSSSNSSVATVVDSGLVTGVAPGVATITATTSYGSVATAQITVVTDPCKVSQAVPIVAGTLVSGTLASTDCDYGDGTYLDAYSFQLASSTNIDVLMRSTAFDAYLYIYELTSTGIAERADDNNSGGGTDARLTGLLPAGSYFILANSNNVNGFGAYTLLLTSPFAGLNAGASMFSNEASPLALHKLSPNDANRFRSLMRAKH